jgi:hypothetical protein
MKGFALAAKVTKIMCSRKICYYFQFVHLPLLRLPGVGFATLLAETIRSDHSYTDTVAAKLPAGKINGIQIVFRCPQLMLL